MKTLLNLLLAVLLISCANNRQADEQERQASSEQIDYHCPAENLPIAVLEYENCKRADHELSYCKQVAKQALCDYIGVHVEKQQ